MGSPDLEEAHTSSRVQLTIQRGANPGATWEIGPEPLIIGRGDGCSISLDDDTVSRLHCLVLMQGEEVRLRDMGSRNRCLVNGKPCTHAILHVGDRLAVGETVFILSSIHEQLQVTAPDSKVPKTVRVGDVPNAALPGPAGETQAGALPQTAQQYATLFQFSLDCSVCRDTASLHDCLRRYASALFGSRVLGLLRKSRDGITWAIQTPQLLRVDVERQIMETLSDGQSRVIRRESRHDAEVVIDTTMVAPLSISGKTIGAAVLGGTEDTQYDREALEFFSAIIHILAPYLKSAEDSERLRAENVHLRETTLQNHTLVGKSACIHSLRDSIRKAAHAFDLHVLIRGETGTGKELAARMVHDLSDRAKKSFVAVNCAAIPNDLFESEFFGYTKGAFTGADKEKPGLVDGADNGTLFLDEVGELSPSNQARLLRLVETGSYRPLGSTQERHVDIRIVSATNRQLDPGEFRSDLFYRLSGFKITLPSLADYREDIPLLAEHFRTMFCAADGPGSQGFSPEAINFLKRRSWTGNVRELRQLVHRAVRITDQEVLTLAVLQDEESDHVASHPTPARVCSLEALEKSHILEILEHCGGDVRAAAGILQIGQSTLYQKLKKYKG